MGDGGITLESVLDSVVRITEQRSRETLEQCLVATLAEIAGVIAVTIARPHARSSGTVLECLASHRRTEGAPEQPAPCAPIETHPIIARTMDSGTETVEHHPDGRLTRCLPVLDGDDRAAFLSIESQGDLGDALAIVRALGAVYGNYLRVLKESERDTLTGLKNRKTFDGTIARVIAQTPASLPLDGDRRHFHGEEHHWLGIVDIDHFKRINDSFGHVFGDEVLLLFAALMRKVFRAEDQLFRFGGEEFIVVLAPTQAEDARHAFERLRQVVADFAFPQAGHVTTSVGFVRIKANDIASKVVGQADEALYWAKRHGRNRVCRYDDLLAAGELKAHDAVGPVEMF